MLKKTLLISLTLFTLPAMAAMYKWVDEEGNTHYSQSPPSEGNEFREVAPPPPPAESPEEAQKRREAIAESIQKQASDKQAAKEEAAKEKAETAKNKERCDKLRKDIQTFQNRGRVRKINESGEYETMTDEAKSAQLQKMRAQLKEECS